VERQGERGGLDVVELDGCVEDRDARCDRGVGHAAERLLADRHDPAARPVLGTFAGGLDHPAHVHAQGEGRLRHHGGDTTPAAGDVAEVDRRRRYRDAHLARTDIGDRHVLHRDHLARRTVLENPNCSHTRNVAAAACPPAARNPVDAVPARR
jgi:hypothetical protein